VHRDIARRGHVGHAWRGQEALTSKLFAPVLFHFAMPGLLAPDVHIMAACLEARFDDPRAVVEERAHRIADHSRTGEKLGQIVYRASRFGNFVVRGLDARNVIHHVLDLGAVAAGRDERNIELTQEFRDEASGKSICAV